MKKLLLATVAVLALGGSAIAGPTHLKLGWIEGKNLQCTTLDKPCEVIVKVRAYDDLNATGGYMDVAKGTKVNLLEVEYGPNNKPWFKLNEWDKDLDQ